MNSVKIIISLFILSNICFAQNDTSKSFRSANDSLQSFIHARDSAAQLLYQNPEYADSLNLTVSEVIITGNEVTKKEIITREMRLKPGNKFTNDDYEHDLSKIYNTGLFNKVDIIPIPVTKKEVILNVDVQEKWYIFPLPEAGIDEGDWKKLWVAMNLKWHNFRGRNETLALYFRLFYNPAVRLSYSNPWIGKDARLYTSASIGYYKFRNQSLTAIGKTNNTEIRYNDYNYDNYKLSTLWTIGKYITDGISAFTDLGFDYLRVSEYREGRTVSTTGRDKYLILGAGIKFDSRDNYEFATKGFYTRTSYTRFGFIDRAIDFGKFNFESQSFIPVYLAPKYYITIASKLYTSEAVGAVIPLYHHEFLGYGNNYVRGWKGYAFEGENLFTAFNELRVPVLQPQYIKADELPVLKGLPIIKKLDLKYGLYFTVLYDIGAVWFKNDNLKNVRFRSGTGIGLNFILPFGYVVRADWAFRISKPVVGEISLSLNAKF